MNITPRNREVLAAIVELERSPSPRLPTLADVAKRTKMTRAGVHRHVVVLVGAGALLAPGGRPGLISTREGREAAK